MRRTGHVVVAALLWGSAVAFLAAGAQTLAGDPFAMFAVFGFALFVHGPVVLAATAWLSDNLWRRVLPLVAAVLVVVGVDAYQIEPHWIERTEVEVLVPDAPRPLTIAVIADLQTDGVTGHERRALEIAMAAEPDLILFPGDLVQMHDTEAYRAIQAELAALFREVGLSAPLGVYAVDGNVDVGRDWTPVFAGTAVQAVDGAIAHFEPEPGVHVTALPFYAGFDRDQVVADRPGLHIAFAHGPDFALGAIGADLLIAGHTHGGQVQLPWFGPVLTLSRVPRPWASGRTDLGGGRTLFVSRGIGMERHNAPRLRFMCRPEVLILKVRPA